MILRDPTIIWIVAGLVLIVVLVAAFLPPARTAGIQTGFPTRIVVLEPNTTDTVVALGAKGALRGVPNSRKDIAKSVISVGGSRRPDWRRILAVDPELVILSDPFAGELIEKTRMYQIPTLTVEIESIETVLEGIAEIGERLGRRAEAAGLKGKIRGNLDTVSRRTKGRSAPRVLLVVDFDGSVEHGIYVPGKKVYLNDLISLAGGHNCFGDEESLFVGVSKAEVQARDPEVIVVLVDPSRETDGSPVDLWRKVCSGTSAARDGRIHVLEGTYTSFAGPGLAETAENLFHIFHGEAVGG